MKETVFVILSSAAIVLGVAWVVLSRRPRPEISRFMPLGALMVGVLMLLIGINLLLPRGPQLAATAAIGFILSGLLLFLALRLAPRLETPESRQLAFLAVAGAAFVVLRVLLD